MIPVESPRLSHVLAMLHPCAGVFDLFRLAQRLPTPQARLDTVLLLLGRVGLPPRVSSRFRVDPAGTVTMQQAPLQLGLLGHARSIETLTQLA